MKHLQKNAYVLALLAAMSLPVLAADTATLRVTGTIIPTACTPSLSGEGVIDYDTIVASSLSSDSYTLLSPKSMNLTVTCDAPAKFAITGVNMRSGTVAGGNDTTQVGAEAPAGLYTSTTDVVTGLGLDGTSRVGGYNIVLRDSEFTADGNSVALIRNSLSGTNEDFIAYTEDTLFGSANSRKHSWAVPGSTVPKSVTILNGKLNVQAYINKVSELDITKPIKLDGMTTIELIYL